MNALGILTAVLVVGALGQIWYGYTLMILWGWFITPVFGVPALQLAPAIGLTLLVGFLTHQVTPEAKDDLGAMGKIGRALGVVVLKPAVALLVGVIVKQWM